MSQAVCIQRYSTFPEALVACGALQAHGFVAAVDNQHHVAVMPHMMNAFGGIGIILPQQEAIEAISFLKHRQTYAPEIMREDTNAYEHPRRYGVVSDWVALAYFTDILLIPPMLALSFIIYFFIDLPPSNPLFLDFEVIPFLGNFWLMTLASGMILLSNIAFLMPIYFHARARARRASSHIQDTP